MAMAAVLLWVRRVVGWRVRLERSVGKALRPYADDHVPPIEAFVSRDVLPKGVTDAVLDRVIQNELDDLVRAFVSTNCARLPHQAPRTRVTILETLSGVVDSRAETDSVESPDDCRAARRLSLFADGIEPIDFLPGRDLVLGGPHAPEGVHRLPDKTLSARHAKLTCSRAGYAVTDLGSLNRTYVNGSDIGSDTTRLQEGDRLQLGDLTLNVVQKL